MVSARRIRRWYWIHKWSSLICTAFMLLLCVTGLPLIFFHEIDQAMGRSVAPPELTGAAGRVSLDQIVQDAGQRNPDDVVTFLMRDEDEPAAWSVTLAPAPDSLEASAFYTYDIRTGEFLNAYPLEQGFMHVMYNAGAAAAGTVADDRARRNDRALPGSTTAGRHCVAG